MPEEYKMCLYYFSLSLLCLLSKQIGVFNQEVKQSFGFFFVLSLYIVTKFEVIYLCIYLAMDTEF